MNFNGEWLGFYVDPRLGQVEFPIRANLTESKGRVRGNMADEMPRQEQTIDDILMLLEPENPHRANWEWMNETYPNARVITILPKDSKVEGSVLGMSIRFTKTYQGGPQVSIWEGVDPQPLREEHRLHPIEYEGQLSSDGSVIEGRWQIKRRQFFGLWLTTLASGTFRLTRTGA